MRQSQKRVRARVHWVGLVAFVVALSAALFVEGYTHHLYGVTDDRAGAHGPSAGVPGVVHRGGPLVDARPESPDTVRPAARTVALTFDDGPDPVWTPQILDVLRKHRVKATFFLVGTQMREHPDLVRRILAEGHQVGLHTLTHADLSALSPWQQGLELSVQQLLLNNIAGTSSALLRPPYSATPADVDEADWAAMRTAAVQGYLAVLSTRDGDDWRRPGVEHIVRSIVPTTGAGEVVLLHDGGGDRSQTVQALDRAIPLTLARGDRFATVGDATGVVGATRAATDRDRLLGWLVDAALGLSGLLVRVLGALIVLSGLVTVVRAVLVLVTARRHRLQRASARRRSLRSGALAPVEPVTVIVPAHNEAAGIEAAVRSIAASEQPVEVIVVDDGSTDGTADLVEGLGLASVRVIRKRNGGKPSALNAGLAHASNDIVVMVDGDTVFEPGTVHELALRFSDPAVGAVSGNTKVANRGGVLGRWQHIEYVIGFNLDRRLFDVAECMPTVPGAVGAFRRSALRRVGGVSDDTLAEDTDLTMALCRDGWRVVYEDRAVAWTEAPASLGALWRQRYRWCYGTLQAMWKHRGALVQSGQGGKLGRRGLSYLLLLQVLLPLLAPAVDVFAVYGLLFLDPWRVMTVWLVFLGVQAAMAFYAFRLDGERAGPLWALPLQQVVYRQLMYLVVIQSLHTAFAGSHLRWHRMERYGSLRVPGGPTTGSVV